MKVREAHLKNISLLKRIDGKNKIALHSSKVIEEIRRG